MTAFLVDWPARGLGPATVTFYANKLRHLQTYLDWGRIQRVEDVIGALLRKYLLDLSKPLNSGGVHCAFRAMRPLLR